MTRALGGVRVPVGARAPGDLVLPPAVAAQGRYATTFRDEIRRLAKAEPKPSWILIAAEPVTDVDTTAADMLTDLDETLNAQGVSLIFAELKDPVRAKIQRYGLTRTIDPHHFFPTIAAAISAFRDETGAQWTTADQSAAGQVASGQIAADGGPPPDIPAAPSLG
jgi:anti-anti-sigma regulatory factor